MVNSGPCPWRPSPVRACHEKEAAGQTLGRGRRGFSCLRDRGEAEQADTGPAPLLQVAGSDKGVGSTDSAQVDHCTVIGHLYRLPDAGLAAFQHLEFVHSVLHTQWQDFVPWKPLPERKHSLDAATLLHSTPTSYWSGEGRPEGPNCSPADRPSNPTGLSLALGHVCYQTTALCQSQALRPYIKDMALPRFPQNRRVGTGVCCMCARAVFGFQFTLFPVTSYHDSCLPTQGHACPKERVAFGNYWFKGIKIPNSQYLF